MSSKCTRFLRKSITLMLCSSFVLSMASCSKPDVPVYDPQPDIFIDENVSDAGDETLEDTSSEENIDSHIADIVLNADGKITDNGKPIVDYDEFVNGEWLKEQEGKGEDVCSAFNEERTKTNDRLREIVANTDLSKLDQNDGLYKAITIYNELLDVSDPSVRTDSIKEFLEPIENIKTLDDLYAIYSKEEYAVFNNVFRFNVEADGNGNNTLCFRPYSIGSMGEEYSIVDATVENKAILFKYCENIGLSEDRVKEIYDNSLVVEEKINKMWEDTASKNYMWYYTEDMLGEKGITVPIFKILKAQNALGDNERFLIYEPSLDFINDLFKKENVPYLRDELLNVTLSVLSSVSGDEDLYGLSNTTSADVAFSLVMDKTTDVFNKEYKRLYLDEQTIKNVSQLEDDLKRSAGSLVYNVDWMSNQGRTTAREKIQGLSEYFGSIVDEGNDLSDVTITGDAVKDYIALMVSKKRYYTTQLNKVDTARGPFNMNILDCNASYFWLYNSLVIGTGLMCHPICSEDTSYEEKLGLIGAVVGHEIAHAYGPSGINYDRDGYYENWIGKNPDEEAEYYNRVQKIVEYFDGMEVAYGRKVNGMAVADETFADILAVQICLKKLAKEKNPDYDTFFRTLAKFKTQYLTEEGVDYTLNAGYLPGKQRVNCVFAQFDIFYEVYDIDENSPYFVPEDQRLKTF